MNLRTAAALAALLSACATPPPAQKMAWDQLSKPERAAAAAAAPASSAAAAQEDPGDVTPAAYAARFPSPVECEAAARRLLRSSPDRAWAVLRACVERGKFTALKRLLDGAWDKDLRERND